jgi:glutathione S-transferase
VAQVLNAILGAFAWPKKGAEINESRLEYLDGKTAQILFAVAEAVLGENFLKEAPEFIYTVDEYMAFQRQGNRDAFTQALLLAESPAFNLLNGGGLHGFSRMSIKDRQGVLSRLSASDRDLHRNLYVAFVNVSAATFYASPAVWPRIRYDGVSVDHPEILNRPPPVPWRPNDARPVEQ